MSFPNSILSNVFTDLFIDLGLSELEEILMLCWPFLHFPDEI